MIAEFIAVTLLLCIFLWIWWRRPDWVLRSVLLTTLLIFGWRCEVLYEKATTLFLRVSLHSSVEGQAQFFYDKGQGFNEIDSSRANIRSDGQYRDYLFSLPHSAAISSFRFDPLMGSGTMRISEMAIVNVLGHRLLVIEPRLWRSGQQIRELNLTNNEIVVVMDKDADDPQLILRFLSPLILILSRSFMTAAFFSRVLLEFLVIGILTALVLAVIKIYLNPASPPPGPELFLDVVLFLASLFLFRMYARGKWEDTIGFVRAWLNS